MSRAVSGRGFFARLLLDNIWLKLISLLCALSFYAFIHSAQNAQRTVAVKLVVEKPADTVQKRLMSDIPGTVDVTLLGPRQQLQEIRGEDHSITLDLRAAQNVPELQLVPEMIADLPPRVRVDRIFPSRLEVRFEDIISRDIKVQVSLKGEPSKGMELQGAVQVKPDEVTALGIATEVNALQYVHADPFQITGLGAGDHERTLKLEPAPDNVSYSQKSIRATVKIGRKLTTRAFEDVAIEVLGVPNGRARPRTLRVTITGPPEIVNELRKEALIPRAVIKQKVGEDIAKKGREDIDVELDMQGLAVEFDVPTVVVSW